MERCVCTCRRGSGWGERGRCKGRVLVALNPRPHGNPERGEQPCHPETINPSTTRFCPGNKSFVFLDSERNELWSNDAFCVWSLLT
ncbi:hypothetical protein CDAR_411061 [Caerostris darwini]|uniref:Uncharacterized protein n=1 Tax=Caerostris darwini TaxID=1538125 RepID=A0AAV4SJR5_9ARAC|nr:hypothetical protein CDAR_411061 [Caerostris darwini]